VKSTPFRRGTSAYPEGPEMEDALVATAARPQDAHFDDKLEERQPRGDLTLRTRIPLLAHIA
jgi:hypothetical protein